MTKNQIMRKLEKAGFNMALVVEASRDWVEVFTGEAADYDKNRSAAHKCAKILGGWTITNTGYGGWIVTPGSLNLDTGNCL